MRDCDLWYCVAQSPAGITLYPLVGRGFISSCVMTKMSDHSSNAISMIIAFTICGIMIFAAYLH
jgi:hypothetical protein